MTLTIIILILIWIGMAIGMPLLELVVIYGVSYVFSKMTDTDRKAFVIDFLRRRAERKAFYIYMATMSGIVGFPWGMSLAFEFMNPESGAYLRVQYVDDNSIWYSLMAGVFVTAVYILYLYKTTSKNKETYSREILKGLEFINDELQFNPNKDWFSKQTEMGIKSLGKRYNREHNFPHNQLPFMLAMLDRDISQTDHWIDNVETFIDKCFELADNIKDEAQKQAIEEHINHVIDVVNTSEWTENDVNQFKSAIESIFDIFSQWYGSLKREERAIAAYDWNQYSPEISKFLEIVRSPWLDCLYKQVMLVTGKGGMGKSHLMGSIIDKRNQTGKPTILLLGEWFSPGKDPWNRIKERLDVLCRKETFLKSIDTYAEETGERVQIIIDGINEGSAGRDYWASNITTFLSEVAAYKNIGIILSIRTTDNSSRFDDYIQDPSHATYEVFGFPDDKLAEACEYMFDSFGLTTPSWAVMDGMFSSPLWLVMYCAGHSMLDQRATERENRWQIVEQYIDGFDVDLAKRFNYSKDRHLLRHVMFTIADKMIANGRTTHLPYTDAMNAVSECVGQEAPVKDYFDELLEIGILRQSSFKKEATIQFEYEMYGNIIIAYQLASQYKEDKWNEFASTIYKELTEMVPLVKGKEMFACYTDPEWIGIYKETFKDTLQYRTTLTESGMQFLKEVWDANDLEWMLDVISRCATNLRIPYNASQFYKVLYPMTMMDRDSCWTIDISQVTEMRERLYKHAKWAMEASRKTIDGLDGNVAELIGETLVWCLCSTQGKLRDTATKGLVNLLRFKQPLMIKLIDKYYDVNDLYITERLWGVAFGCCTQNADKEYTEKIAKLAQHLVFDREKVIENILVTDYARLIIDYAITLGNTEFDGYTKHTPPYNSYKKIPKCRTQYIVKTYVKPYQEEKDEEVSSSALKLMDSMATEYTMRNNGNYGDFGRYTFQFALREFPENPEDLANWGIKIIFKEFGYEPNKVKWFDAYETNYGDIDWERIGKKYQWLVLYKIAAILTDYHASDGQRKKDEKHCIYDIRNIDPTLLKADKYKVSELQGVHLELPPYGYEMVENEKWLKSTKYGPNLKQLIRQQKDNETWITLHATPAYLVRKDKLKLGELNREFWTCLQSCFVDKRQLTKVKRIIDKNRVSSRDVNGNSEIYHIYGGEWYWSANYKEYVTDVGYEYKQMHISTHYYDIMIRPSMVEYALESHNDRSSNRSDMFYYPNSHMVQVLGLTLYDSRGIWTNGKGEIVLFDNAVTGGDAALMIRQDALKEYLTKTDQEVIWPITIEKRVRAWHKQSHNDRYKYKNSGGYAILGRNGRVKLQIRQYNDEMTRWQLYYQKRVKPVIENAKYEMMGIGIKLHLVHLTETEMFDYQLKKAISKHGKVG